jgi:predicted RNA-binding Zn-ribbon protein involved in translation (DUF1610 family)
MTRPVTSDDCPRCGADAATADYQKRRQLPQVGRTWTCQACGGEVTEQRTNDEPWTRGDAVRNLQPVTTGMARHLSVFDETGQRPDDVVEDLVTQGANRAAAVDYHMVNREGLSQSEWALRTNRDQSTVSKNVASVADLISERGDA